MKRQQEPDEQEASHQEESEREDEEAVEEILVEEEEEEETTTPTKSKRGSSKKKAPKPEKLYTIGEFKVRDGEFASLYLLMMSAKTAINQACHLFCVRATGLSRHLRSPLYMHQLLLTKSNEDARPEQDPPVPNEVLQHFTDACVYIVTHRANSTPYMDADPETKQLKLAGPFLSKMKAHMSRHLLFLASITLEGPPPTTGTLLLSVKPQRKQLVEWLGCFSGLCRRRSLCEDGLTQAPINIHTTFWDMLHNPIQEKKDNCLEDYINYLKRRTNDASHITLKQLVYLTSCWPPMGSFADKITHKLACFDRVIQFTQLVINHTPDDEEREGHLSLLGLDALDDQILTSMQLFIKSVSAAFRTIVRGGTVPLVAIDTSETYYVMLKKLSNGPTIGKSRLQLLLDLVYLDCKVPPQDQPRIRQYVIECVIVPAVLRTMEYGALSHSEKHRSTAFGVRVKSVVFAFVDIFHLVPPHLTDIGTRSIVEHYAHQGLLLLPHFETPEDVVSSGAERDTLEPFTLVDCNAIINAILRGIRDHTYTTTYTWEKRLVDERDPQMTSALFNIETHKTLAECERRNYDTYREAFYKDSQVWRLDALQLPEHHLADVEEGLPTSFLSCIVVDPVQHAERSDLALCVALALRGDLHTLVVRNGHDNHAHENLLVTAFREKRLDLTRFRQEQCITIDTLHATTPRRYVIVPYAHLLSSEEYGLILHWALEHRHHIRRLIFIGTIYIHPLTPGHAFLDQVRLIDHRSHEAAIYEKSVVTEQFDALLERCWDCVNYADRSLDTQKRFSAHFIRFTTTVPQSGRRILLTMPDYRTLAALLSHLIASTTSTDARPMMRGLRHITLYELDEGGVSSGHKANSESLQACLTRHANIRESQKLSVETTTIERARLLDAYRPIAYYRMFFVTPVSRLLALPLDVRQKMFTLFSEVDSLVLINDVAGDAMDHVRTHFASAAQFNLRHTYTSMSQPT